MYFFKLRSREYSVFPTGPISVYVCLWPLMPFCVFAKQLRTQWVTTDPGDKRCLQEGSVLENTRVLADEWFDRVCERVCVFACLLFFLHIIQGDLSLLKSCLKTDQIYISSNQTACLTPCSVTAKQTIQKPKLEHKKVGRLSVRILNIICSQGLFLHYSWGNTVRVSNRFFSVSNRGVCENRKESSK